MTRARRAGAAAAATGLGLLLAAQQGLAACKLQSMELPVTMMGTRPVATLMVNGTPIKLLVDTGAFYSMLTPAAAAQLKLPLERLPRGFVVHGVTGEIERMRMTSVKQVQLLGGSLPHMEFLVGGNEIGGGTMGILGRNLLSFTDVEYDLAHGLIRFMFPNDDCAGKGMAYWAGETPVSELKIRRDERELRTPPMVATIRINDRDIRALFDSGASSTVLALPAARRIGITDADMTPAGISYGAGSGSARNWIAPVAKVELGGEVISNNTLRIGDFDLGDTDMLLGIDFFLSHRIYVSRLQRKMFFTYNGGPVFQHKPVAIAAAASAPGHEEEEDKGAPLADAAAYARRGAASVSRLEHARALKDLDRACEMAPEVAEYFVRRAAVQLALQQPTRALADYDRALQLDPAQDEARLQRATMRLANRDRSGAAADLAVLDQALPAQAHQRQHMAALYLRLDMPREALQQWDHWIPLRGTDVMLGQALHGRCWARTLLNTELDKALADCDKAVDLQGGKSAQALDSRARVRVRRGEWREALADFERALALDPKTAPALYGRGLARIMTDQAEAGRADIEAARQLRPRIDAEMERFGMKVQAPGKG